MKCYDSDFDAEFFPVRRRTDYSCADRMCGALDCANCHPELQELAECVCCGAEYPLWVDWYGKSGNLCEGCAGKVPCSCCGEWLSAADVREEGLCAKCAEDEKEIAG